MRSKDAIGWRELRELARTYHMLTEDSTRAKNRLRSAYRRRGTSYPGHGLTEQAHALPELAELARAKDFPSEALNKTHPRGSAET